MQIGSSMFFFSKSLKLQIKLPKFDSSVFADWCEHSWLIRAPLNVDNFISEIKTLESVKRLVFTPIPQLAAPICWTGQEDIIKVGIGSDFVNRPIMSGVDFQILLRITLRASIDNALFSGCQIHGRLSLQELEWQSTRKSEVHIVNVLFLVVLGQSSEEHQIVALESFLHGPFSDSSVRTDRYKGLTLATFALRYPLNVPHCVCMFIKRFSIFGNGSVRLLPDVINWDSSILTATCNQVGIFNAELASGERELAGEYLFGECGILEGPEH